MGGGANSCSQYPQCADPKRVLGTSCGDGAVECAAAWMSRFQRSARDHKRLPEVLACLHVVPCVCLLLHRVILFIFISSPRQLSGHGHKSVLVVSMGLPCC